MSAGDSALLGDFGIAELMTGAGLASWGGSFETMAPEVAGGGPTSVASDVYSLGATLYALLAGEYGHNDADPAALQAKVISGPPPNLRDVAAPRRPRSLTARHEGHVAKCQGPIRFASRPGRGPRDAASDSLLVDAN
jgi:serine/threonine protein kinase